jgi:uncharacterized protein (DUF1697 family)
MADLRAVVESLGYDGVATYIQSGNVVFGADAPEAAVVAALEAAIESSFGFTVPVVARTADEFAAVAELHLLATPDSDPRQLMVAFLDRVPDVSVRDVLDPEDFAPDRFALVGRHVFLEYPNGSGRSKLSHSLLEGRLGVRATLRNWNTVGKLVSLARQ